MVLIRADANEHIGTGHIIRCLSIARAIVKKGEEVKFITADHRGDRLIQNSGFDSICLDSEWTEMDGEIDQVKRLIMETKPLLILIDSYYVTDTYLSLLSDCVKTVYIDDLNIARWNVDVLINYNIFSMVFNYSSYDSSKTKLLLGPQYTPLRDEFKNCPIHAIKSVSDILVSAGGADPVQITEKLLENICPVFPNITFHFIVGVLNPRLDDIKNMSKRSNNAIIHINEQHMADLMKDCDIAISAAGTTLYELCATGIPTITYTLADNQLIAAEQFYEKGIMLSAGDCRNSDTYEERIKDLLHKLIMDRFLRKKLSEKMQRVVDGRGAERIAASLLY